MSEETGIAYLRRMLISLRYIRTSQPGHWVQEQKSIDSYYTIGYTYQQMMEVYIKWQI